MNKARVSAVLLFFMLARGIAEAQTITYRFANNAQQEGLLITRNDSTCFQFRHAIKYTKIKSVVDNGYVGQQIEIGGIYLPSESGTPNIPIVSRYIAIPNGATAWIEVNNIQSQTIHSIDLMAAPPILPETDTTKITYEKDSAIYHTNAFYPSQIVKVSDTFRIRGVNIVAVSVCPYQYNPVTQELIVHHDISVNVRYEGGDGHFGDDRLRSPYWDPILMQCLANYDQLPIIDYEARMDRWISTRPSGCEYLIVIPNNENFRPYADSLKNYRIKQGILTEVKSLSDLNCSSAKDLEVLFHYAYNNWEIAPVAVCLLGDHNDNLQLGIPGKETVRRVGGEPSNPEPNPFYITDNSYADTDGDKLPDIVFSRLVAADTTQARMLVSKQLEYEYLSPNMTLEYYDHPVTSTCWCPDRWFQICAEAIGGFWGKQGKHPNRINELYNPNDTIGTIWSSGVGTDILVDYFGPTGLDYIPLSPDSLDGWTGGNGDSIITAINNGSMLVFHRDHGDKSGWLQPYFDHNYYIWLDNEEKLTFVISIDCQTGMFNCTEGDCLIEGLLRQTSLSHGNNAGAVGCIAPTSISYSFVNDVYAWGLFDFFTPDFLPDVGQFADYEGNWLPAFANVSAKYFLSQNNWAYNIAAKPIMYDIYTSHCDAFLRLFSVVPQTMIVDHPSEIEMSQGRCYVTAPAGAVVALTEGNNILKVATATGNPQILEFEPQDPNTEIDIVVTKQDYLRYVAHITHREIFIDGPSVLDIPNCDGSAFVVHIPDSTQFTYDWNSSSNLSIVSTSESDTAFIRPVSTGTGSITVDVFYQGQPYARITKGITVTTSFTSLGTTPISISSNATWSSDSLLLEHNVSIEPNTTLTITGTVSCCPNTNIIVKPGGQLRIIGGHLMGICEEEAWKGIQVHGESEKHQFIENGMYWQGYLELSDSATLENAIIAIDVWNPEDYSSTGGIIKAENSYFINNTTAVSFHPYENKYKHPHQPDSIIIKDNTSRFESCEFIVNEHYPGPNEFEKHVQLFGVRGVTFKGCHFMYTDNAHSTPTTIGLYAYNSGFKISGACDGYPCQTIINSSFDGFHKAVVSVNDGSVGIRPALVRDTDFTNNSFGVYAHKSGFLTILNSIFSIGQDEALCATGIYAESTPYFTIEQDTFRLAQYYPYENYGIVIKNSNSQNLIYKNVFDGLYCANLSVGRNNTWMMPKDDTSPMSDILGLEYRCNENSNNICDFYVSGGNSTYRLGIQNNQGTRAEPANNTFSQSSLFQFENHGNYGINYFYDVDYIYGTPSHTTSVTTIETDETFDCPSHYGNGWTFPNDTINPGSADSLRRRREADYYEAYSTYLTIKAIYDNLINGGDTEGELTDIRSASSSDMWALRAQLLGHSPYLTNKVLVSMLDRDDVFPQSVLFEILASNPDELKNDTLFNYLEDMDNPLPDYMIGLLRQMADGFTARTAMESQLARYSQNYRQAAGDLIRYILCDTVIDRTALIGWLGNMNAMESDREIISIYLEDGNYTDAMTLANMLPTLYGLSGDDLADHSDYMTLLNLYRILNAEGRNTMQLDSTERAIIEHIAEYGTGASQALAKSIMMGIYGYGYDDCPSGLDLQSGGGRYLNTNYSDLNLGQAAGLTVVASPNPASTWVTINYTLPTGASKAQMRISNSLGITLTTYDLTGNEGQKILDLRQFNPGVYTYTVYCGKYSQTEKLVIVK